MIMLPNDNLNVIYVLRNYKLNVSVAEPNGQAQQLRKRIWRAGMSRFNGRNRSCR